MPPAFDPYYKWLGIPPQEQPPNHYRLLALRAFEDDPDVIESAADQRMAHLRTFQGGQYAALSQKLLNEVATAKVCLLNPQKRARYDQDLKAQQAAAQPERGTMLDTARQAPPAPSGGSGFDLASLGVGSDGPGRRSPSASAIGRAAPGARPPRKEADRRAPMPPASDDGDVPLANKHIPLIVAGASCLALVLLIAGVLMFRKSSSGDETAQPGSALGADPAIAVAKPKPTATPAAQRDELLGALKAFTAAHPPGPPESPLARGPLGRGLILHMSFEPATIEQRDGCLFVRDLSGAGHHGVSANAQLWGQGKVGTALLCQSPLQLASAIVDRQTQFTLVAWVSHPASVSQGWWYNEAGADPIFAISTGKEVELRSCGSRPGPMSQMRVPDAVAAPDTWNFFALRGSRTAEGQGRLMIQLNDARLQIQNDTCLPASMEQTERYASLCTTAGLRIDELMAFDRVLSDAELRTLRQRSDPNDGGPQTQSPAVPPVVDVPKPSQPEPERPRPLEPAADAMLVNGSKPGGLPAEWMFRWTAVADAQDYEVKVESPAADKLTIDTNVVGTSLRVQAHGVAAAENCPGWRWRVRAKVHDSWGPWSDERRFELQRPRGDDVALANAAGPAGAPAPAKETAPAEAKAPAVTRRPVPDSAAQRKALELLNDVYGKTIAAARNRDVVLNAIAEDMVRKAPDNQDDAAGLYVLLDRARILAAEAGSAALAMEICDQIDKSFEIKLLPLKLDTLTICLKKTNLGPDQATETATAAVELMQDLAKADNVDGALAIGQLARDHLRKPSDPTVMRRVAAAMVYLHEMKTEAAKVSSARQKLREDASDADANLAVGRFECFVRRDWQSGLEHLAKGSDAGMRDAAQAELAVPHTVADREKLADLWYERAKRESAATNKQAMYFRARYWYEGILGEVTGLQHSKIDKRITQIGQLLGE